MNSTTFLELLKKSKLVSEDQLDEVYAFLETLEDSSDQETGEIIGQHLMQLGILTSWQLRQLLKRKSKGFFVRQYKILGLLGVGGMSSVYLAEHTLMQRRVAIKILPKERLKKTGYLDFFIREAQVIATLDHPNIIRAYDIDREDDIHYIVMEFFEGINLQKKVDTEGPLTVPVIVDYVRQAAEALFFAHKIGIIHRDVKPSNLLVNKSNLVKLLDLGLAMIDQQQYSGHLSTSHKETSILGTADYLAPEQAINSQTVDARADIYALGGVLYFCLTGHAPFPTGSVTERLLAHQQKTPQSILVDRPNTPEDLVAICQKMMQKNPDNRQQTTAEVALDLQNWLVRHGQAGNRESWTVHPDSATTVLPTRTPVPKPRPSSKNLPRSGVLKPGDSLFAKKTSPSLVSAPEEKVVVEEVILSSNPNIDAGEKTAPSIGQAPVIIGESKQGSSPMVSEQPAPAVAEPDIYSLAGETSPPSTSPVSAPSPAPASKQPGTQEVAGSPQKKRTTESSLLERKTESAKSDILKDDLAASHLTHLTQQSKATPPQPPGSPSQQYIDDDTFDRLLENFVPSPVRRKSQDEEENDVILLALGEVEQEYQSPQKAEPQVPEKQHTEKPAFERPLVQKPLSQESEDEVHYADDLIIGVLPSGVPSAEKSSRVKTGTEKDESFPTFSRELRKKSDRQALAESFSELLSQAEQLEETGRPVAEARAPLVRKWYERVPNWAWIGIGFCIAALVMDLILFWR